MPCVSLIEIGLTSSEDALSAQELESAVDSGYQQLIAAIEGSRFAVSSDRGLSTRVDVSGGAMQINGEETEAGAERFGGAEPAGRHRRAGFGCKHL